MSAPFSTFDIGCRVRPRIGYPNAGDIGEVIAVIDGAQWGYETQYRVRFSNGRHWHYPAYQLAHTEEPLTQLEAELRLRVLVLEAKLRLLQSGNIPE